jgi:D-sedoheptulose 7-phosphate isomerase
LVQAVFSAAIDVHQRFAAQGVASVVAAAAAISRATAGGRKVLAFGNGGSAGDAQHFVTELVGRFEHQRRAIPAVALTADSSVLTAVANDYGYEHVFTRQIEALGHAGDVCFGISTSGRSRNVEHAMLAARRLGLITIALTGRDGGGVAAQGDIVVNVPEDSTARVQEVHRTILHAICLLVERSLAEHQP